MADETAVGEAYVSEDIHSQARGNEMPHCALKVIRCVQRGFPEGR